MRPYARRLLLLSAAATVLAATGLLLEQSAERARTSLELARGEVQALADALADGDEPRARRALDRVRDSTAAAYRETSGPLWDVASLVPVLGRTPHAVQEATRIVDDLTTDVLPAVTAAALDLAPDRLRSAPDGIDLGGLSRATAVLASVSGEVQRARQDLARVELRAVAGTVVAQHAELTTELTRLADLIGTGTRAGELLPAVLGADAPRRYFVAFQTNAEARGTGGLVGAYGILEADNGRLSLTALGDNTDLFDLPAPRVSFGPDFEALHGPHYKIWPNTNTTAHFPYAAALWLDMWEQATGQALDGAIALDLVALAELLDATGPVALPDGEQVSAANVVALTGRDAYARFDGEVGLRKQFLVGVAESVAKNVLRDGAGDPLRLLRALRSAAEDRRVQVYSVHPAEQAVLESSPAAGVVPDVPGPFVAVVVNNSAANKLDYYLRRDVRYELGPCRGGRRQTTVVVRLHHDVPAGDLPAYVTGQLLPGRPEGVASSRLNVAVYAAQGATLTAATLDGQPVPVAVRSERGHPVLVVPVELVRQQRRELVLRLDEPALPTAPVVLEQPLVHPQTTTVRQVGCRDDEVAQQRVSRTATGASPR